MSKESERAVTAAAEQFVAALNAMFEGDLAPMKQLWSHADDVVYMAPDGGEDIGWQRVLANWERQAALYLGGAIHIEGMRTTVGEDLAVAYSYGKGENANVNGKPQKVSTRVTMVFRKEGDAWKMAGLHVDPLPFLE